MLEFIVRCLCVKKHYAFISKNICVADPPTDSVYMICGVLIAMVLVGILIVLLAVTIRWEGENAILSYIIFFIYWRKCLSIVYEALQVIFSNNKILCISIQKYKYKVQVYKKRINFKKFPYVKKMILLKKIQNSLAFFLSNSI